MKVNELYDDEGFGLPALITSKSQSQKLRHQKSDNSIKYRIKSDLRVNFLTRYNKRFWESTNMENNTLSHNKLPRNLSRNTVKHKSQNIMALQQSVELDLIEINDFEDRMKSELENIDRWIFNNLKKMTLPEVNLKGRGEQGGGSVNMDLQMLDLIIQASHQVVDPSKNFNSLRVKPHDNAVSREMHSKIAVTNETLNNDHNKIILVELIKKKVSSHDEYNSKDESYNMMIAKMIATDLIASFKTLSVFRHQNVLRLKEVLESISEEMRPERASIINSVKSDAIEDYLFYERSLRKHLKDCDDEIKHRKDMSKWLLDTIRQKKNNINIEKQKLFEFVKMLEEKENETGRNRKVGEKMKLREFMEINEYKSRRIKLEAGINQFVKANNKDIDDMNRRLEKVDFEAEDYKFKRTWFIFKLKEYYNDFLMNETLLVKANKSIIVIIKGIWNLNEEVFNSSFSKFYEKEDVVFAMKYAKVHNEFLTARAEINSKKKDIKHTLKKNFDDIINEDEYCIIETFKDSLKKFKSDGLKLYERKKISSTNRTSVYKYFEVAQQNNTVDVAAPSSSKTRNRLDDDQLSVALAELSDKLSQLKEQHIQILLKRTIEKNNRSKLLGLANSEYLKKILRLLFGYQDMQMILQRLLKNSQIQIVPI